MCWLLDLFVIDGPFVGTERMPSESPRIGSGDIDQEIIDREVILKFDHTTRF